MVRGRRRGEVRRREFEAGTGEVVWVVTKIGACPGLVMGLVGVLRLLICDLGIGM